jgi:hypothetical protein
VYIYLGVEPEPFGSGVPFAFGEEETFAEQLGYSNEQSKELLEIFNSEEALRHIIRGSPIPPYDIQPHW